MAGRGNTPGGVLYEPPSRVNEDRDAGSYSQQKESDARSS
jgi:hypothetical protein